MAIVGEQLLQPESGWQRIDDTNLNISYGSTWVLDTGTSTDYGTYVNKTIHCTFTNNDSCIFYIYSNNLRIVQQCHTNRTKNAKIIIDDTDEYTYSTYTSTFSNPAILVFEKLNLGKSIHKVEIYGEDLTTSSVLTLDAIDIDEDGYMLYCDDNDKLYYDVTPIMTSNNTPAPYVASASSRWDQNMYDAYSTFNSDYKYEWYGNGTTNQWLKIMLNNDRKFNEISFKAKEAYITNGAIFKKLDIQISENDSVYETICTLDNCDKSFWLSKDYINNDGKVYEFIVKFPKKIYSPKYVRFYAYNNNGSGTYISVGEINFLLDEKTPFYLIQDNTNGKKYSYDEVNNTLVEVTDTSILKADALNNTCI